jgi:hypothetical protein
MHTVIAGLLDDAPLIAVLPGFACGAIRERETNTSAGAVDIDLRERIQLRSEEVRRDVGMRFG